MQIGIDTTLTLNDIRICLIEFYVKKAVPTPSSVDDDKLPKIEAEMAVAARPACIPFFSYTNVAHSSADDNKETATSRDRVNKITNYATNACILFDMNA